MTWNALNRTGGNTPFTTVPAEYIGGNAFHDLNNDMESSTVYHMNSNATSSVEESSTAYHMKSYSFDTEDN